MRFSMPHFPQSFEIPDEWLDEAGFNGFTPNTAAFNSFEDAVIIPLTDIEPVARFKTVAKDGAGFDQQRLVDVLRGIVAGSSIDPVLVSAIPEWDLAPSPYRFRVRDGYHRFYASIAAGFVGLPTTETIK